MASELLYQGAPKGAYAPGFPAHHMDGPEIERAARIRGLTKDEYVAQALSIQHGGKPRYRPGTRASEDVKAVAAEVKAEAQQPQADELPAAPPRKRG